jgi:hypothetical protein
MMNLKGPLYCHSLQLLQTVLFNLNFWFLKGSSIVNCVHASYEHKTEKVMRIYTFLLCHALTDVEEVREWWEEELLILVHTNLLISDLTQSALK